jgi:hypothetical protein
MSKCKVVLKYYNKIAMRAFIVSLGLVYLNKIDIKTKRDRVISIINQNTFKATIEDDNCLDYEKMQTIKKFEEYDFSARIKVNYENIYLNSDLKENLYCIFICVMTRIPLIIIGNPGSSKSLACRIVCDNLRDSFNKGTNEDQWL